MLGDPGLNGSRESRVSATNAHRHFTMETLTSPEIMVDHQHIIADVHPRGFCGEFWPERTRELIVWGSQLAWWCVKCFSKSAGESRVFICDQSLSDPGEGISL